MFSDTTIRSAINNGLINIKGRPEDFKDKAYQPASVELHLGNDFIFRNPDNDFHLDVSENGYESVVLWPGDCVLARTSEELTLPNNIIARVEGKSTWGRHFLLVHATAGFVDPGFSGSITLELVNLSKKTIHIPIGAAICQVSFDWLEISADRPYGHPELNSHYQGQIDPTLPHDEVL